MSNVLELEPVESQRTELALSGGHALTPMDMLDRAVANGSSIEVLTKLMDLQDRWSATQARKAFDAAMADAKSEIPVILKNRTVDYATDKGRTTYRHEDLAEIARTVDPILAKYGLSYRFRTTAAPNEPVTVTCIVSHRGGHSEENSLPGPRDDSGKKNALQQIGSAITYLQRYTLKAALGLAASTDDDSKATGNGDPINEEQYETLRKTIVDSAADLTKFLEYFKIEKLEELPASRYADAITALKKKAKAAEKAA